MTATLQPIAEGLQEMPGRPVDDESFAMIDRSTMTAIARTIPDAQSAVLFCLAWHAAVQRRMKRGELAQQFVARVSASDLAKITGCPIRTVRYALSKLRGHRVIENVELRPGRKAIYRLLLCNTRGMYVDGSEVLTPPPITQMAT